MESERQDVVNLLRSIFDTYVGEKATENDDGGISACERLPRRTRGMFIIGKESPTAAIEYAYWKWFDTEEQSTTRHYLCEDGEWAEAGFLVGFRESFLTTLSAVCVQTDSLDATDVRNLFTEHIESLQDAREQHREQYTLDDIVEMVRQHEFDTLKNVVAPDGEDAREFWKLLFSRESDGYVIENEIQIPHKDDQLFLARAERQYSGTSREKTYPFGLVIGRDDTEERFFAHRLPRYDALEDENYPWDRTEVQRRMGFEVDYTELDTKTIPTDTVTRIQGNLSVVPTSIDAAKTQYTTSLYERGLELLHRVYFEFYLEQHDIDSLDKDTERTLRYEAPDRPTPGLVELQETLGIDETAVRTRQQRRDIQRLSANLRGEILFELFCERVRDCVRDARPKTLKSHLADSRFSRGMLKQNALSLESTFNFTDDTILSMAQTVASERFRGARQTTMQFENHVVLANPAFPHPGRSDGLGVMDRTNPVRLERIIVPDSAHVVVGHDEHHSQVYEFPRGCYEFRYLIGLDPTDIRTNNLIHSNPVL